MRAREDLYASISKHECVWDSEREGVYVCLPAEAWLPVVVVGGLGAVGGTGPAVEGSAASVGVWSPVDSSLPQTLAPERESERDIENVTLTMSHKNSSTVKSRASSRTLWKWCECSICNHLAVHVYFLTLYIFCQLLPMGKALRFK